MIPSAPKVVICPKCGKRMSVFQIASGNTCGARYWSDGKMEAPMLPQVSPIFKCDACGKYFRIDCLSMQECGDNDDWEGEKGVWDFYKLKAAREQFEAEGTELPLGFLALLIQGYNDKFNRDERKHSTPTSEDKAYFRSVVDELMSHPDQLNDFYKAEFYRETERFDECLKLLPQCEKIACKEILEKEKSAALAKQTAVFNLYD